MPSTKAHPASPQDRETAIRTFLIADVRGYTHFTRERGDEAAARIAAKFAEVAVEGVEAFQGDLVETRGDEILAVFGSPRRALRAGVELQDAFAHEAALEPSLPLRVGIGLAAGEAVPVGDGFRGNALNMAARLCATADAGVVLATEELVGLAGPIDGIGYEPAAPLALKGVEGEVRPVRVFSAAPEPSAHSPDRPAGPLPDLPSELDPATAIVGREHELRVLRWFWRRARHGRGRAVFLQGASGAGKTRLAAELAREARAEGAAVVYAACAGPADRAIAQVQGANRERWPDAPRRRRPRCRRRDASRRPAHDRRVARRKSAAAGRYLPQRRLAARRVLSEPRRPGARGTAPARPRGHRVGGRRPAVSAPGRPGLALARSVRGGGRRCRRLVRGRHRSARRRRDPGRGKHAERANLRCRDRGERGVVARAQRRKLGVCGSGALPSGRSSRSSERREPRP